MQIILTEKEYTELTRTNHQLEKLELELAKERERANYLQSEYSLLRDKYNKLLVFGVAASNERLKG